MRIREHAIKSSSIPINIPLTVVWCCCLAGRQAFKGQSVRNAHRTSLHTGTLAGTPAFQQPCAHPCFCTLTDECSLRQFPVRVWPSGNTLHVIGIRHPACYCGPSQPGAAHGPQDVCWRNTATVRCCAARLELACWGGLGGGTGLPHQDAAMSPTDIMTRPGLRASEAPRARMSLPISAARDLLDFS